MIQPAAAVGRGMRREARLAFLLAPGLINNIHADNRPRGISYGRQGLDDHGLHGAAPESAFFIVDTAARCDARRIGRDIQEICVWNLFFLPWLQS